MEKFTRDEGLLYVRNDDSICRAFEEPPIVVNYFFHEEIVPSAKKRMKKSSTDKRYLAKNFDSVK